MQCICLIISYGYPVFSTTVNTVATELLQFYSCALMIVNNFALFFYIID